MNFSAESDSMGNSTFIYFHYTLSAFAMTLIWFTRIISVLNITVYCFAVVANIVIIMVLLKDGFKLTSNICFFALAIVDLLISMVWIPSLLTIIVSFDPSVTFVLLWIVDVYLQPCGEALHSIGSWIMVIVTLERLCCIMFPLKVTTLPQWMWTSAS